MSTRTPTENRPGSASARGADNLVPRANEPGPSSPPERDRRLIANGTRFLTVGAIMVIVGVVLYIVLPDSTPSGIGAAIALLGSLPATVGAVMLVMAWVDRRARKGKSFA
jgi:hypothetical protein